MPRRLPQRLSNFLLDHPPWRRYSFW